RLLAMAEKADLFAVISFRTGPGRSELPLCCPDGRGVWYGDAYVNNDVWKSAAAQDGWVAMWRHAAGRYRGRAAIAGFDLMVEPNSNAAVLDPPEWDPDRFYAEHAGSLLDWNTLHPRLTAAIREVDPNTPILLGPMGYSSQLWLSHLEPSAD